MLDFSRRIFKIDHTPGFQTDKADRQKKIYYLAGMIPAFPILLGFSIWYGFFEINQWHAWANLLAAFILGGCILRIPWTVDSSNIYRVTLAVILVLFLFNVASGHYQGADILWVMIYPVIVFYLMGRSEGMAWALSMCCSIGIMIVIPDFAHVHPYSDAFKIRFIFVYLLLCYFTWLLESIRRYFYQKQKTINDQLNDSERRYRLIAENAADVIWKMDMEQNFQYISPSVRQMHGWTVEEGMQKTIEDIFPTQSLEKVKALYTHRLTLAQSGSDRAWDPLIFETEQFTKKGSTIWTSTHARVLPETKNEPMYILGITRDITDKKRNEEEKILAQIALEEHKKLALVGQVAGKMAHDFNNVLGIIMGNAELSLLECKDPEIKKTLELIFDQTRRGENLTKNLVAFAKDQEPKQIFFNINDKIGLVIDLLKKDLEGIEMTLERKPDLPELLADPGMIEHALVNLIQNAIHATSLTPNPEIIIKSFVDGDDLCFEIEDNGCGISEEHVEHIFDPSFSLKGSRDIAGMYDSNIKGSGDGMANVKKYIEGHKGRIFTNSQLGAGTKFTIKLPIINKELSKTEIKELQVLNSHSDRYILIVEDEQAISDIQYNVLTHEPCDHRVDIANSGQMAIDMINRNTYDFVSLDYLLPGKIDGMDVYHHIRKTNDMLPVLFISGNLEFLESVALLKQKDLYVEHLSKPCMNTDYINTINSLLDRAALKQ